MASPAASLRPRHTATTDAPPHDGGGWEGGEGDGTELRPLRPSTSAPCSLPARAWAAYTAALAAHPLRTRACTAGALAALADAVGQALAAAPPPPGRRRAYPLSGWRRSLAWGAWGVLVSGPAGHAWQAVLDRVLPMPGGAAAKAQREEEGGTAPPTSSSTSTAAMLAARVAADAGLFSPAVNALALAFIATVIEGGAKRNGGSSTAGLVRARLPATQAAAWRLWPAASAVAYLAIPPRLRVLFFNAVGFWWTLLLSSRAAKGGGGERGGRRA